MAFGVGGKGTHWSIRSREVIRSEGGLTEESHTGSCAGSRLVGGVGREQELEQRLVRGNCDNPGKR